MPIINTIIYTNSVFKDRYGKRDIQTHLDLIRLNLNEAQKHLNNDLKIKSLNELVDIMSISYGALDNNYNHGEPKALIENRLSKTRIRCRNGEFD